MFDRAAVKLLKSTGGLRNPVRDARVAGLLYGGEAGSYAFRRSLGANVRKVQAVSTGLKIGTGAAAGVGGLIAYRKFSDKK
jgi:hypothetical protein